MANEEPSEPKATTEPPLLINAPQRPKFKRYRHSRELLSVIDYLKQKTRATFADSHIFPLIEQMRDSNDEVVIQVDFGPLGDEEKSLYENLYKVLQSIFGDDHLMSLDNTHNPPHTGFSLHGSPPLLLKTVEQRDGDFLPPTPAPGALRNR